MPIGLIFIVFIVLVGVYLWSLYNQFVTIKTRIKASIQEIGNQLKRQAELIPNLVAAVEKYFKHEKEFFTKITDARKEVLKAIQSGEAQKMVDASQQMQSALAPIRVVLESTPSLQAAGPTTDLMAKLEDTADKLMYARRTLIDLTADYNIKVVAFPSNLVAQLFHFKQESGLKTPEEGGHLEVSAAETVNPKVKL